MQDKLLNHPDNSQLMVYKYNQSKHNKVEFNKDGWKTVKGAETVHPEYKEYLEVTQRKMEKLIKNKIDEAGIK